MKVRVVLTVDIDLDALRAEYDDPNLTAADARDMVRGSALDAVATPGVAFPEGIIQSVDREDIR